VRRTALFEAYYNISSRISSACWMVRPLQVTIRHAKPALFDLPNAEGWTISTMSLNEAGKKYPKQVNAARSLVNS
jgi:hypothetical protein